jgi:hypothetical protein
MFFHESPSNAVVLGIGRALCCAALLAACESSGPSGLGGAGAAAGSGGSGPGAGSGGSGAGAGSGGAPEPGMSIEPAVFPQALVNDFDELRASADAAGAFDAAGALAAYPASFRADLGYDPATSSGLDLIQGSALALSDGELSKLGSQGFVVSTRREFPTFLRGFAEIYSEDLPLYVSADAILESVHSSYDTILAQVEQLVLIPELDALLAGMHARLADSDESASTRRDVDLYLAVARGLLAGSVPALVADGDAAAVNSIVQAANAATGIEVVELFGVQREEDFSQFEPRGHYTGDPTMERYFRAMIWLGRIDMRILETLRDGSQVFRPEQYRAMLLLNELIAPDLQRWRRIDDAVRTFVGESDSMVVPEIASLVEDLGGPAAARTATDADVVAAIVAGGYGQQQIASHLMRNDDTVKTLPLNRSFLVFGQRYIPDSHVFSEAVYDRVADRMMPDPLDAAFAALGNNQALALEADALGTFPELPGALARMRVLIDAHDDAFWDANFYSLWLKALRALSPADDLAAAAESGLPAVARTEAWGRRLLGTQLGSWAELRHDTLLYAKQSYTGIPACEFPDAYVDPYPEFFDAVAAYAAQGERIAEIAAAAGTGLDGQVRTYFNALHDAATRLAEMARAELAGTPFTAEQLAFINDAVRVDQESAGCTVIDVPNGWYADLFFERAKSIEFDPTIADVHTQPADESGNIVGHVLHVGTGYPRYMVTTIDTCTGPRAYAGVVYAYHEQVTDDFTRLTDEAWATRFSASGERPAEVPWMTSVLAQ